MIFANVNLKRCVKSLPHFFQNRANYIAGAEDTADAESVLAPYEKMFYYDKCKSRCINYEINGYTESLPEKWTSGKDKSIDVDVVFR